MTLFQPYNSVYLNPSSIPAPFSIKTRKNFVGVCKRALRGAVVEEIKFPEQDKAAPEPDKRIKYTIENMWWTAAKKGAVVWTDFADRSKTIKPRSMKIDMTSDEEKEQPKHTKRSTQNVLSCSLDHSEQIGRKYLEDQGCILRPHQGRFRDSILEKPDRAIDKACI